MAWIDYPPGDGGIEANDVLAIVAITPMADTSWIKRFDPTFVIECFIFCQNR
jgi:hypothetical protein